MNVESAVAVPNASPFKPLDHCWVCGGDKLRRVHEDQLEFSAWKDEDPELAAHTGTIWLRRCGDCGFIQPEALPTLPNYFDRIYKQQWSDAWIEGEFESTYKDFIFGSILERLGRQLPADKRRVLDVGAHVGRFIHLAAQSGWQAEGVELNPRTAAFAARRTALPVHQLSAKNLAQRGPMYDAVTLTDVLEHIPDPVQTLRDMFELLCPGGWLAVKVPCGANQLRKERLRALLVRGYRPTVAPNLVHVNHFGVGSLKRALQVAGFTTVTIAVGAPELPPPGENGSALRRLSNLFRMSVYRAAQATPGGVCSPLALNLQAYAQKSG